MKLDDGVDTLVGLLDESVEPHAHEIRAHALSHGAEFSCRFREKFRLASGVFRASFDERSAELNESLEKLPRVGRGRLRPKTLPEDVCLPPIARVEQIDGVEIVVVTE